MFSIRTMKPQDFDEVAELIYLSTNAWYESKVGHAIFQCRPQDCRLFPEVYEDLDPGCGLVVVSNGSGMIVASCFFHPRELHMSLGIMNVHPNYFGHGLAGRLLSQIVDEAESRDLPLRLVSSALNLDSFSLYSRFGFSPFAIYQDLILKVPSKGLPEGSHADLPKVREAEIPDLTDIGRVEFEVAGISRERDYAYFLENQGGIWHTLVSIDKDGIVDGFLTSLDHPASKMIGPGVARTAAGAEALLRAQLDRFRNEQVVFLLPTTERGLIENAYAMGARNCELHFGQVLGAAQPVAGVVMPSFLPESA